jgi:S-adenosylmethionine decarboxylase
MTYQSSPVGTEISCVMHDINPKILNSNRQIKRILIEALAKDDFKILEKVSHKFNPKGYTITILLAESHAAIHTFPEHYSLFFYLYSCRRKNDGRKTFGYLEQTLNPFSLEMSQRDISIEKPDYAISSPNSL